MRPIIYLFQQLTHLVNVLCTVTRGPYGACTVPSYIATYPHTYTHSSTPLAPVRVNSGRQSCYVCYCVSYIVQPSCWNTQGIYMYMYTNIYTQHPRDILCIHVHHYHRSSFVVIDSSCTPSHILPCEQASTDSLHEHVYVQIFVGTLRAPRISLRVHDAATRAVLTE